MRKHLQKLAVLALSSLITVSCFGINAAAIEDSDESRIPTEAELESEFAETWVEPEARPEIEPEQDWTISEDDILGTEIAPSEYQIATSSIPGTIFDDVAANSWYAPYVEYVLNKGIMTGMGNNTFAPGETLARAHFATVLYRLSGSEPVTYSPDFPDVPDGTFFTAPVLWAAQDDVDVIRGYDNGNFGPTNPITREQLATMLYRYTAYLGLDIETKGDLSTYPDADTVSPFAQEAMEWAVGVGIITGDQGLLNPEGISCRAVCAAMIQRFCESILPEELPDVDMSARCETIIVSPSEFQDGTFWVKLMDLTASHGIQKVYAAVWCNDDQSDIALYEAAYQPDGSYGFSGNVSNHKFHFGNYKVHTCILMKNGVRLWADLKEQYIDGTDAINMRQTAQRYSSSTNYLLIVDTNTCRTGVFQRNGNQWDYLYYWPCSPGAPATPTVKGEFTVYGKGEGFYSFGSYQYYYTQFYGDYLFHSIAYNDDGSVQDGRLGMQISHGCVRLDTNNALWLYNNIPYETKVVIY